MSVSGKIVVASVDYVASRWTANQVAAIVKTTMPSAPIIGVEQGTPLFPQHDLWDIWPVQNADGSIAVIAGGTLWMVLSTPRLDDPRMRHDIARIRLLNLSDGIWRDCGLLFPDDLSPGSREWSGSARYDDATATVTAYFTAAGRRGETITSFEQRLFETTGHLDTSGETPAVVRWSIPQPLVINDGAFYVDLAADQGKPGNIRGFRDPYWFCDPFDDCKYLLFTGSLPGSVHECSGVVGLARAIADDGAPGFQLMPPIVSADGVANEMERPHMLMRDGQYYLFWSTQHSVFADSAPKGPSGLYGMVGPTITGPFKPLNGSGLVIANPPAEPYQAYCWQVLDTLEVISFVDYWGLRGRDPLDDPALNRAQFGGTIAPMLKIAINGATTELLELA